MMKTINLLNFILFNIVYIDAFPRISKVKRFKSIIKSPFDKRSYRGIKLSNDLEAVLISDTTTDRSAASMTVGVGSMFDPKDLEGLAHLFAHMLFLRSRKYPQDNDFKTFVYEHDGHMHDYTYHNMQTFIFEISSGFLAPALDRFAQYFCEPLIDDSFLEREIMTVNSEYETQKSYDDFKLFHMEAVMSKENHPFRQFINGNSETLDRIPKSKGISVVDELLKYFSNWYSSNIMTLVVIGRESLDELENMVVSLFEGIENKHVKRPKHSFGEHPWPPVQLKHKIYIVPVEDIRLIKIVFTTSCASQTALTFLSHIFSSLGEGTIFSVLREMYFCEAIEVNHSSIAGNGFFNITIEFKTEAVLFPVDEIITLVFQYIHFLKKNCVKKSVFDEIKKIDRMKFFFKKEESMATYVKLIGTSMHYQSIENILSYDFLLEQWEPTLIQQFFKYLKPDNMNVFIVNKLYEDIVNQTERWYGIKYKVEIIPNQLIKSWKEAKSLSLFQLPHNKYFPENFVLHPVPKNEPKYPYVIHESWLSRIWFKQDDEFQSLKLNIRLELFSVLTRRNVINTVLLDIYISLLKETLENNILYSAQHADIDCTIKLHSSEFGIEISLIGYDDKLPLFLQELLSKMANLKISLTEMGFDIIQLAYLESLTKLNTSKPANIPKLALTYLLCESCWEINDMMAAAEELALDDLVKFVKKFFSRIFFHGFIYGNCTKEQAVEIVKIIETPFKWTRGLLPRHLLLTREVELKEGSHSMYEVLDMCEGTSYYYVYFQCNAESLWKNVILELLLKILTKPCENIPKTQGHSSSSEMCRIRRLVGVQGFTILIETDKHPLYVDFLIDEFLETIPSILERLEERELEEYKNFVIEDKLKILKDRDELTSLYWREITHRFYNFNRVVMEIEQLSRIKSIHIIDLFNEMLNPSSRRRRKLTIHVMSRNNTPELPNDFQSTRIKSITKIENTMVFKSALSLSPISPPYIKIAPLGATPKI